MRQIIFLIFFFCTINCVAQTSSGINIGIKIIDSCENFKLNARKYYLFPKMHSQPLYVANNVVIRIEELDTAFSVIEDITLIKCLESFKKFDYLGLNGVIYIKTKQQFEVSTPVSICKPRSKNIKGNFLYALNGFILRDTNLLISTKAVIETERFVTSDGQTYINIWTLSKDERKSLPSLCRGLRITQ